MKGTVVMRFMGNKQEPEESLAPEGTIVWPTELSRELTRYMEEELQREMERTLQLLETSPPFIK